jgi:hypothetical protein
MAAGKKTGGRKAGTPNKATIDVSNELDLDLPENYGPEDYLDARADIGLHRLDVRFGGKADIIGPEGQCLLLTQSGH